MAKINVRVIRDYFYIIVGTALAGFSVACFFTPAKIVSGGVNGVATICYYVFGFDTGLVMLFISVPLFLLGVKIFGPMYGFKCLLGTLLYSAFTSIFGNLTHYAGLLAYTDRMDTLLSAIYGGLIYGTGIGIVMRGGSNTGGTDIVAQIINKYTPLSIGSALFLSDAVIILIGAINFGFERAMFAVMSLFATTQMINFMVINVGTKQAKTAYIISDKYEAISQRVVNEMRHTATELEGKGIYSQQQKKLLLVVVRNQEINRLLAIVEQEDPKAFAYVHEAYYALGMGFSPFTQVMKPHENTKKSDKTGGHNEQNIV